MGILYHNRWGITNPVAGYLCCEETKINRTGYFSLPLRVIVFIKLKFFYIINIIFGYSYAVIGCCIFYSWNVLYIIILKINIHTIFYHIGSLVICDGGLCFCIIRSNNIITYNMYSCFIKCRPFFIIRATPEYLLITWMFS